MVGRNGRPAILGRIDIGLRRAADREIGAGNAELRLDELGEILRAHAFARLVMEHVLADSALERFPLAGGGLGDVPRSRRGFVADLAPWDLVLGKTINPADSTRAPRYAFDQSI